MPTPSPGSGDTELHAVAAVSSADAWAVGYAMSPGPRTLVEHWDGTAWSIVPSPNPGNGGDVLLSVTAVSPTDVWAVGFTTPPAAAPRQTLVEHWNGSTWSAVLSPSISGSDSELLSVSGSLSTGLWAVGFSLNNGITKSLVERWDGEAWAIVSGTAASRANVVLTGVAPYRPSGAWAVGYLTSGPSFTAFAARWNGTAWIQVTMPQPGTSINVLRGVVTDSLGHATAVGSYYDTAHGNYSGFSEYWNGSTWAETSVAQPASGPPVLRAVTAVPGSNLRWAVGKAGSAALAESTCNTTAATARIPQLSIGATTPPTSGPFASPSTRAGPSPKSAAEPSATDIAASAGISESLSTYAAAVADYNGDGNQDFFLVDHTHAGQLWLSDGPAHFTQVDVGTFRASDRHGCVAGDANSDGRPDIFCPVGAQRGNGEKSDELWIQGPGTTFTDTAASVGLIDPFGRGRQAAFIDVNGDGRPDIFVSNEPFRGDGLPSPNRLFLNTGSGYIDAPSYGLDKTIGGVCAQSVDYNGDGRPDLLLCPQTTNLKLYQNVGGVKFIDVSTSAHLPGVRALWAQLVDMNGDGLPDLVVLTASQLLVLLQSPDHTFSQTYALPVANGAAFAIGDANGDGHPDIYVVRSAKSGVNQPDMMLISDGTGTGFTSLPIPEVTAGSGDRAYPIDAEHNGLADFLVLNGKYPAPGPMQLIAFFP